MEEQEKLYPVIFEPEHYTVMGNNLVKGKQAMTVKEAKLLRLIITQVVKEDKDFKTFQIKITELADFMGIAPDNLYRDVPVMCKKLLRQVVEIKTGNSPKDRWKMFQWVNRAEYDGDGTITFRLSDDLKPYILNLSEYYTQYQLKEVLSLSSFYAIRLYELLKCESGLKCDKNSFEFSIEELREFFECKTKYKQNRDFINKTVKIATEEINRKTNLSLQATLKIGTSKGNPILGASFETHWFENLEEKNKYDAWVTDFFEKKVAI